MKFCKPEKYFKCRSTDQCIDKSLTCDNVADCRDASDEGDTMCEGEYKEARKPCDLKKEFECEAKICIPKKKVCDGTKHCLDGRDEEPKMCGVLNVRTSKLSVKLFSDFTRFSSKLAADSVVLMVNVFR